MQTPSLILSSLQQIPFEQLLKLIFEKHLNTPLKKIPRNIEAIWTDRFYGPSYVNHLVTTLQAQNIVKPGLKSIESFAYEVLFLYRSEDLPILSQDQRVAYYWYRFEGSFRLYTMVMISESITLLDERTFLELEELLGFLYKNINRRDPSDVFNGSVVPVTLIPSEYRPILDCMVIEKSEEVSSLLKDLQEGEYYSADNLKILSIPPLHQVKAGFVFWRGGYLYVMGLVKIIDKFTQEVLGRRLIFHRHQYDDIKRILSIFIYNY